MQFENNNKTPSALSKIMGVGFGICFCASLIIASSNQCLSQELEPRRWTHLPTGLNFAAAGYAYTESNTSDSPALRLENVEAKMHTWSAGYIRTFELLEKSARVEIKQAYQEGRWTGQVNGTPAATERRGLTDTIMRFAMNVYGAPPLSGEKFRAYRAKQDVETIAGMALVIQLPTGEYMEDRLINLGSNRFTFRPQFGVVHNRGKWSMELTGSTWIFTDNDDFFGSNRLEQDPFFALQGHFVYTHRPGLWAGLSAGYGYGAQSTLNGEKKDDRKSNLGWAISLGYPITPAWGVKLAYVGSRRLESTGQDTDSIIFGVSHAW